MVRFLELIAAVVIVAILLVVVGVFLPSSRHLEHSIETNRPSFLVYDAIDGFQRFGEWHPLTQRDPRIRLSRSGARDGEGAVLNYSSTDDRLGEGSITVAEAVPQEKLVWALENDARGHDKQSVITLDPSANRRTTKITWEYDVDYGWDLIGRYSGLYVPRTVGEDMKVGLSNLNGLLATMPRVDYSALDINEVIVQPKNIVFASVKTERNITAVENQMVTSLSSIRAAIGRSGYVADGPPRMVITNFGGDEVEFDVALPIRPSGAPPTDGEMPADPMTADPDSMPENDDTNADGEVDGAESMAAINQETEATLERLRARAKLGEMPLDERVAFVEPAQPPAIEGLELPPELTLGVSYGGPALAANFTGHSVTLPLVRDGLRTFAAANGFRIRDRAFEKYLTSIEDTPADQAVYRVYWPIEPHGSP